MLIPIFNTVINYTDLKLDFSLLDKREQFHEVTHLNNQLGKSDKRIQKLWMWHNFLAKINICP